MSSINFSLGSLRQPIVLAFKHVLKINRKETEIGIEIEIEIEAYGNIVISLRPLRKNLTS